MSQNRREFLQTSLAAGIYSVSAAGMSGTDDIDPEVARELAKRLKYLVPPDGTPPDTEFRPSPPAQPFTTPLFVPRIPVPLLDLSDLKEAVTKEFGKRQAKAGTRLDQREQAKLSRQERAELADVDQYWTFLFFERFNALAKALREKFTDFGLRDPLDIGGPPDFLSHQRFFEFKPKYMFFMWEREFPWAFHADVAVKDRGGKPSNPWGDVSWTWGYWTLTRPLAPKEDGAFELAWTHITPGPAFYSRYGEPILVRRINDLPEILDDDARWQRLSPPHRQGRRDPRGVRRRNIRFAYPSTTSHLHNAHTASESDGHPNDWINPGEYWDHHYANFPSGFDPREKLSSLWYHDHRMDFTAANVYAGLTGFYLLFDEIDTHQQVGDVVRIEPGKKGLPQVTLQSSGEAQGWKLPSGKYDVPLMLHDLLFGLDEQGHAQLVFDGFNTEGILGDRFTVNRTIQPNLQVERRKYRFRIYNGGPSRFYELFLHTKESPEVHPFIVITGDGNLQPNPVWTPDVFLGVAQRVDVIIDFSSFPDGTRYVYLVNQAEQINGRGPTGRHHERPGGAALNDWLNAHSVMRFELGNKPRDPSTIPLVFRALPPVDLTEVRRTRIWEFDHDGGLWTINGKIYDPNRIDAGIEQGTAEMWIFRNSGNSWHHPIHSHFTEHIIVEINDRPFFQAVVQEGPITGGGSYPHTPPGPADKGPVAATRKTDKQAMEQTRASFSRRAFYFDAVKLKQLAANKGLMKRFGDAQKKLKQDTPAKGAPAKSCMELLKTILEQLANGQADQVRFESSEQFRCFIEYLEQARYEGGYDGPIPNVPSFMGGPRRDIAVLLPGWEVKVFMRWGDFLGKHVLHCHNVVHEDHAMMIRWDIMPKGRAFDGPRAVREVYGDRPDKPHVQPTPGQSRQAVDDRDKPNRR